MPTRRLRESEAPPVRQADQVQPEVAGPIGLNASGVLALQQTAGNQGVVRALAVARQTATANKIEQLDATFDRSDVPEDTDAIALLGVAVTAAEKANGADGRLQEEARGSAGPDTRWSVR